MHNEDWKIRFFPQLDERASVASGALCVENAAPLDSVDLDSSAVAAGGTAGDAAGGSLALEAEEGAAR